MRTLPWLAVVLATGCRPPEQQRPLSDPEARASLDQAVTASAAMSLTAESIELSTDFTLGAGVERALDDLAAFYRSQVPCSTVTLVGPTVTVDYGRLDDGCRWRGRTWGGTHALTLGRNERAGVQVTHTWTGFTDGVTVVDGEAVVDWDLRRGQRRVTHQLTWRLGDHVASGAGDQTQSLLAPAAGLAGGIRIEGERDWDTDDGMWTLRMENIEARPQDPVPQAGRYVLETPFGGGATVELSFERRSATVIRATLHAGDRDLAVDVRTRG